MNLFVIATERVTSSQYDARNEDNYSLLMTDE